MEQRTVKRCGFYVCLSDLHAFAVFASFTIGNGKIIKITIITVLMGASNGIITEGVRRVGRVLHHNGQCECVTGVHRHTIILSTL